MSFYDTRTNTERGPRRLEVKLSDGARLGAPDTGWTPELLAVCGLVPIVDTERPADTDTDTHTRSVELFNGVPTVVWTQRPWRDDELAARLEAQAPDPIDVLTEQAVTAANADPQPWEADRRYLPGAIVLDGVDGDRWQNDLGVVNVWPLTERHARWTNLDFVEPTDPQPWQPWSGFPEDLYNVGAEVTHSNPAFPQFTVWKSNINANTQEPGMDGTFHRWWEPIG